MSVVVVDSAKLDGRLVSSSLIIITIIVYRTAGSVQDTALIIAGRDQSAHSVALTACNIDVP
jgi:hypothetical protein